ncbi:MAG TPA: hypothetical protein VMF52_18540 [Steroidobacteraceae bacterium]|nr:hypothetical protein [Steroidobacteraceae bacterium]
MCVDDRRRRLLAGLALSPLLISGCSAESDEPRPTPPPPTPSRVAIGAGCYQPSYAGAQAGNFGCGLLPAFGNPLIDGPWQQEIQIQAQFYAGVAAQVFVMDECSPANMNALASPDGYILMGRYMANDILQRTGTNLPIAGVLAHEWAHRAQFTFGWMVQTEPTVRRTELEADMWSGLYMGLVKSWTGPLMQSYFQTLFNIGDFNFNNPGHHGTPNQRYAAGATGITLAFQLMQTGTRLGYEQIHALFLNEVTRITTTIQKMGEPELERLLDARTDALDADTQRIARRLDTAWIRGIALGKRSLDELTVMPDLPSWERMNLAPY